MSIQQTLQKWIPDSNKSKISIFDFDNTLFNSHKREEGEIKYFEETGKPWPFEGWYGRIETLQPPLIPNPIPESFWIQKTLNSFREDKEDSDVLTVLMTGRPYKIRHRIQEILKSQELIFDREIYRGMKGQKGKDTIDIKIHSIETEILNPQSKFLKIYEDRQEHLSIFMTAAKRWKNKFNLEKITIFDVTNDLDYNF